MEEFAHLDSAEVDHLAAKLLAHWDWRSEPGGLGDPSIPLGSSSPESSAGSTCSSPEVQARSGNLFGDFAYPPPQRRATQSKVRVKMSTRRRMKASEREKLRMRSLAEALHQLRDYLPPVYSRRGQPLTKIQTLKYTIEYIKELSDILNQD